MNSSGDIARCVVPSRQGVLSVSTTLTAALVCTRSLTSAGQVMWRHSVFHHLAMLSTAAHCGVRAETLRGGSLKTQRQANLVPGDFYIPLVVIGWDVSSCLLART